MRFEMVRPRDLGPAELAAWDELRAADPALANPFFSHQFAQIVDAHRPDVRTLVIEDGREIAGFLTVQRPSTQAAMTLGAPIGDYFAVIGGRDMDLDPRRLAQGLRVGRIDFANSLASHAPMARLHRDESEILKTDLRDAAGLEALLSGSRNVKQSFKKERKLAEDHGEVTFEAFDRNIDDYSALIAMKTAQYAGRKVPDILHRPWVARTLSDIFASTDPEACGPLFTLKAGGRTVAAIFCFASKEVLHPWFPAYDPEFARYSVGLIAWRRMVEAAQGRGFREIDMGPGDYAYKRLFANATAQVGHGFVPGRGWVSSGLRTAQWSLEAAAGVLPGERLRTLPGRARRWIDLRRGLYAPAA